MTEVASPKPLPRSRVSDRKTLIVGHRGASGLAPENTLAAFRCAIELNIDGIEFDVQRSVDGHLVVIHDDELDRTSNGTGAVAQKTLDELQALDAGSWFNPSFAGEKIPALRELFELMTGNQLLLFVELKDPARYPGMEAEVAQMIRAFGLVERSQVRSFDHSSLRTFQALAPDIAVSELWWERLPQPQEVFTGTVDALFSFYTEDNIRAFHQAGQFASAWTVNDMEVAQQLINWGLDEITTDYPDQVLQLMGG